MPQKSAIASFTTDPKDQTSSNSQKTFHSYQ